MHWSFFVVEYSLVVFFPVCTLTDTAELLLVIRAFLAWLKISALDHRENPHGHLIVCLCPDSEQHTRVRSTRATQPHEHQRGINTTMSAMVKLAKEIDEPCDIDQPTEECHLIFVVHQERAGYTSSGRAGGARGTEERALTSRTRPSRRRMATWRSPSL